MTSAGFIKPALAEALCYFQKPDGQEVDLSSLCGVSTTISLAALDERFVELLASITDEDSLRSIQPMERSALPQLGKQICLSLGQGRKLTEITPVGQQSNLPVDVFFSVRTAAVEMYCPQYMNSLVDSKGR